METKGCWHGTAITVDVDVFKCAFDYFPTKVETIVSKILCYWYTGVSLVYHKMMDEFPVRQQPVAILANQSFTTWAQTKPVTVANIILFCKFAVRYFVES